MANIAENLRLAGNLERWSTHRHHIGFYNGVAVIARYVGPPGQRLTRPHLFRALEAVIGIHAAMGITILDEDTVKPSFARLRQIDLDEVVTFVELAGDSEEARQQEFDKNIAEKLSMSFEELGRLPIWRIIVMEPKNYDEARGVDVAFVFHHGFFDGSAGQAFHISLSMALDSLPPTGVETRTVIEPPQLPLPDALETIIPLPLSYTFIFKCIWTQLLFSRPRPPTFWYGAPIQLSTPVVKTTFQTLAIPASTTSNLLSACRAEKTTITALLTVALAKSLFAVLPDTATALATSTPINLRRFMPGVTDETMGDFVCSIANDLDRATLATTTDIWTLARQQRTLLEAHIRAGTTDTNTGLLKYISDYDKRLKGNLGKQREQAFEISNLGVYKGERGPNGWGVSRVVFSQSASVTGAAVAFSVASVKGGEMCLGISYQEGVVETELIGRFVQVFKAEMEALAER